jgi:amino acid adenylation domain-containing protein
VTDASTGIGLTPAEKREVLRKLLQRRTGQRGTMSLPALVANPADRHEPFPLTDVQQAYWVGRGNTFQLGNVSCHAYSELELQGADLARLEAAWRALIARHDMLRAVIRDDGRQEILREVPRYHIESTDLRGRPVDVVARHIDGVRARMSHQVLPAARWPLFEICATRLDGRQTRLHISLDLLVVDFWSIAMLVREWFLVYERPDLALPALDISFRDYVLAEEQLRGSPQYQRSMEFWRERLPILPAPPDLPLAKGPALVQQPRFVRRASRLEAATWSRLKARAAQAGLTPSSVLLAAFAEVLSTWSRSATFTLNLTLFRRHGLHPQVRDLIGDFTSVSLLDVDNSRPEPFEVRARRHQERLWENLEHRYVSGVQVLRELARVQGGSSRTLMPVVFTSLLALTRSDQDATAFTLPGEVVYAVSQTPQVWLDHQVYEQGGALVFSWDAVEELFPPGMLQDMFDAYCTLLARLVDQDAIWHDATRSLVPEAQLARRAAINDTAAPISGERLQTLFTRQAGPRGDQPAVFAADRTLTYGELARRAGIVAATLRRSGAQANSLVAVVCEKGWAQAAAVLGVLGSGAAYLPVDPALPTERQQYLFSHGGIRLAVTTSAFAEQLTWPTGIQQVIVDRQLASGDGDGREALAAIQGPEDLAYVIYTSGSSGSPKGVMIDHRGAVNTVLDVNARFDVGPADRTLALSSLGFDLSVYDLFGMFAAGGAVVVPAPDTTPDPPRWIDLARRHRVTIWNSVPALMNLAVEYLEHRGEPLPETLRLVLLSGDWIPVSLPNRIRALAPSARVVSLGGATEASIWSIVHPIDHVDPTWTSIPYGRPMQNQRLHVLHETLDACPVWTPGDLYIGGIGLARGYWRDPEKSASSFFHHPTSGERLYRTGDLGRYLPDGDIEFLGREDFQVKIQGYRVELGEIEAALRRHPGVRDVIVAAHGEPRGEKRLIGHVIRSGLEAPSADDLRTFLSQRLPAYMVPSAFTTLEAFPVNANGKVDRRLLPDPFSATTDPTITRHPDVPDGPLATRIAERIALVLGLAAVDPDEDLVDLGVTSVDVVRIANVLETIFGSRPDPAEFYRQPTASGLARFYGRQHRPSEIESVVATSAGEPAGSWRGEMILDSAARDRFKAGRPGLRGDLLHHPFVPLIDGQPEAVHSARWESRRTRRQFSAGPVSLRQLSGLLGCLRSVALDDAPRFLYPSAGGIYGVQTYVHVKRNRVDGLAPGTYYYHPVDHQLVVVSAEAELERSIHEPFVNRPVFDQAAFSIFLVAELAAVGPLYGRHALGFAQLEAGSMSQLLMSDASGHGLGLCPIGDLDFERIRDLFALGDTQVLVHSLLGGRVPETSTVPDPAAQEERCQ